MGLRPAPRLLALVSLGLVLAAAALASDLALYAAVGWDLALLVAFVVDASFLVRSGAVRARRSAPVRLQQQRPDLVRIELISPFFASAEVIDEPPVELLPANAPSIPRHVRLIAGGTAAVEYSVAPRRRGRFRFGAVNLLAEGPLRLARRRLVLGPSGTTEVHVYPNLGDLDRGALDPELMMAELGIKRTKRRAEGTEFESLREATLEDELRRIDWRATARRGKLIARNYEVEKNHEVLLCLDTGRLMGALHSNEQDLAPRTKLDHAIAAALRLAAVALKNGDRVGAMSFDAGAGVFTPPERGRAQLGRLMEAIYDLSAGPSDASFVQALAEVRQRQRKRALLVFLTDFVDAEASSLMIDAISVMARRHAILFVALRDPRLMFVADAPVDDLAGAYRSLAALGLAEARAEVIEGLAACGVRALDLSPDEVASGAIRAYLALRAQMSP